MAETPYTLKSAQTFRRMNSKGDVFTLRVDAGTVVKHERTETDTAFVHIFCHTYDGYRWESRMETPKVPEAATPTNGNGTHSGAVAEDAPVETPKAVHSTVVQSAIADTAKSVHSAVDNMTARQRHAVDGQEDHIRRLDKVVKVLSGNVIQVNYYIPSDMNDVAPSPCVIFRRHAVHHWDGSNWLFTEEGLNHKEVQEVFKVWDSLKPIEKPSTLGPQFKRRKRVRYQIVPYTKDQLAQDKDAAVEQLSEALQEMHASLIQNIDKASETLKKAQEELTAKLGATAKDFDKVDNTYNATLRSNVRSACATFELCLKGAELYDDTGSLDALFGAARDALATTAMGVNALLAAKNVKTVAVPETIRMNPSIGSGPAPR